MGHALAMRTPSSSGSASPSRLATVARTCCTSVRLGAATRMHKHRLRSGSITCAAAKFAPPQLHCLDDEVCPTLLGAAMGVHRQQLHSSSCPRAASAIDYVLVR